SERRGFAGRVFDRFNRGFEQTTNGYIRVSHMVIRRWAFALLFIAGVAAIALLVARRIPSTFLPQEDFRYAFAPMHLPTAASLQRSDAAARKVEAILKRIPGVEGYITVLGFNLLSQVQATYNVFFFITLKPWGQRPDVGAIEQQLNQELGALPEAQAFSFP